MWLLMIVFILVPETNQVIEKYTSQAECQRERDRIGRDMAEAYPNDHDFNIICTLKPEAI